MKKTRAQIIQAVAIAMRQAYGEYQDDPVVPWDDAAKDKKDAWLAIAEAGVKKFEEVSAE